MSEEQTSAGEKQPEPSAAPTTTEERKVPAKDLLKTINDVIKEGTVRRILVIRKGRTLIDIPLAAGVAASAVLILYLPWITAIAAAGALLGGCTVRIEREEPKAQ